LPGKVLTSIGDHTLLEHCMMRLTARGLPVIVATTRRPEDDVIETAARRGGARVFRGHETDVLERYVSAARTFGLSEIVRATANSPLVDPDAPHRVLKLRRRVAADHVIESGLPVGCAVEAVTTTALERALAHSTDQYDREHVTSFVRRDPRFRAVRAVAPGHLRRPGLRLKVDTKEDLEFVRTVMNGVQHHDPMPELADVIEVADALLVRQIARSHARQRA
jgi:spore coat polysaccharide biosynthesis protein SpsF (cytidylyltransferase family)